MDGKNRRILADVNLMWPNGLTLDFPSRLLTLSHNPPSCMPMPVDLKTRMHGVWKNRTTS